jgi:hypothetical protein
VRAGRSAVRFLGDDPVGFLAALGRSLRSGRAFCNTYDLPIPIFGLTIAGHEADATFVAEKLVLELDSWEFHQTWVDFESDRDRDVDRLVERFATVRLTWERMFGRPAREARRLHKVLADRR